MFLSLYYRAVKQAMDSIIRMPLDYLLNLLSIALVTLLLFLGILVNSNVNNWLDKTNIYPQMILYLDSAADATDIQLIGKQINQTSGDKIKNYTFISGQDGVKSLSESMNLSNIKNLPSVMVINTKISDSQSLNNLSVALAKIPMVNDIDIDMHYTDKVNQLITIIKNTANFAISASLFILCLILYNTIRVQMLYRSNEINIIRLLGASTLFILRPLYFYSMIQVLVAGFIAYVISLVLVGQINSVLAKFNYLIDGMIIQNITFMSFAQIIISIVIAALFAVFVAVNLLFVRD